MVSLQTVPSALDLAGAFGWRIAKNRETEVAGGLCECHDVEELGYTLRWNSHVALAGLLRPACAGSSNQLVLSVHLSLRAFGRRLHWLHVVGAPGRHTSQGLNGCRSLIPSLFDSSRLCPSEILLYICAIPLANLG